MVHLCHRNLKSWKACFILACNVLLVGASSLTVRVLLAQIQSIPSQRGIVHVLANYPSVLLDAPAVVYVIAGLLADIQFGRYKVISCSLFISFALLLASSAASLISNLTEAGPVQESLLWVGVGVYSLHFTAKTSFEGTILHFGLDQLSEASSDELNSFIHWYVWTLAIAELPLDYIITPSKDACIVLLTISMVISAGMLILCLALCRGVRGCNVQFIREPPSGNPYMNVFKVLQFAKNHKTPLHRSAFTYWEDDPPSRLDMGKDKYGGPFTNEQVEDVKTLFRLILSLACMTLMYFVLIISLNQAFVLHFGSAQQSHYSTNPTDAIYLITKDIFYYPDLFAALFIPLHELVLHPLLGNRYLPNMMTKMKIAGILISASLATNLIIDGVGHYRKDVPCMFSAYYIYGTSPGQVQAMDISPLVLILPGLMHDLAIILLWTSILEFTISQAPYPMRGMLIGVFYLFLGSFALLAVGYDQIFISQGLSSLPGYSCCSLYYTIGTILSLTITVLTFWTSHKYKYRERNEVINEYQFVENYYCANSNSS